MKALRRLNLAINKIEEVPETIGQLSLLEWLNLNDNKLETLPPTMEQMQKLVKMGIVQNRLQTLPPQLTRLQLLYKLDCRRNEIQYLPSAYKDMHGIHIILLEENPLTCVRQQHRDSFGGELTELFETTDFHIGMNGEIIGLLQPTMSDALPAGSISITTLNQLHQGNHSHYSGQQTLGPTSELRQTTARLRCSLSRPALPIEIQVDAQGQFRRVVYRQNRHNTMHEGGSSNSAPRRRLLETFRSLSQVGQSNRVGGNGGGIGVLAAGNRGADLGDNGGGRGESNRTPGEVMNVTTFAVELERF
ncbi:hypothetical protein BGZ65_003172 [Modicella reniformis]|uniref:Uncharacterized protein n=1 Tax=Modicella reniformis TaxID=1440133 RepID=A0A9P6M020_9FUNG|nr:hypothetical protein BGZ65_003172 [Modicella reniformis]